MEDNRILVIAGIVFVLLMLVFGWCYSKKSPRVEKWGWRIMGLLAAVFVVFTLWYHEPIVCEDQVEVTEPGEEMVSTVEVEFIIRRSFFHAPELSGWIATPADVYRSSWTGKLYWQGEAYGCSTIFRAEPGFMGGKLDYDNTILIGRIDFNWNFSALKRLRIQEFREDGEGYSYDTVQWY